MANFSLEIGGALSTAWEYAKGLQSIGGPSFQDSQAIGEAIGRGDWESVGSIAQAYSGSIGSNIGTMFGGILSTIVSVGLYNQALGLMSGRFNEVTFDAFKLPFATYLKVFVVSFIVGIISIVAFFCCVIPLCGSSSYLGTRLSGGASRGRHL